MPSRVAVVMTAVSYQPIVEVGLRRDQQNQNGRQHNSHCRGNHTACSICEGKQLCLISNVTSYFFLNDFLRSFVCLCYLLYNVNVWISIYSICKGCMFSACGTDCTTIRLLYVQLHVRECIWFFSYNSVHACLCLYVFTSVSYSARDSIYPSFTCT